MMADPPENNILYMYRVIYATLMGQYLYNLLKYNNYSNDHKMYNNYNNHWSGIYDDRTGCTYMCKICMSQTHIIDIKLT